MTPTLARPISWIIFGLLFLLLGSCEDTAKIAKQNANFSKSVRITMASIENFRKQMIRFTTTRDDQDWTTIQNTLTDFNEQIAALKSLADENPKNSAEKQAVIEQFQILSKHFESMNDTPKLLVLCDEAQKKRDEIRAQNLTNHKVENPVRVEFIPTPAETRMMDQMNMANELIFFARTRIFPNLTTIDSNRNN